MRKVTQEEREWRDQERRKILDMLEKTKHWFETVGAFTAAALKETDDEGIHCSRVFISDLAKGCPLRAENMQILAEALLEEWILEMVEDSPQPITGDELMRRLGADDDGTLLEIMKAWRIRKAGRPELRLVTNDDDDDKPKSPP
jgi:hypothetical protein